MLCVVQIEDVENEWCRYTPTFDDVIDVLTGIVMTTAGSVTNLPQVQNILFQFNEEGHRTSFLNSVTLDPDNNEEEILRDIGRCITAVILRNIDGPEK